MESYMKTRNNWKFIFFWTGYLLSTLTVLYWILS